MSITIHKVRDGLQNIMGTMTGPVLEKGTFDQLNTVLKWLDELCGQPVRPEGGMAESAVNGAVLEFAPAGQLNPAQWLEAMREAWKRFPDEFITTRAAELLYELVQHLDLGRWEIVVHKPTREQMVAEIDRALGDVSEGNPAYAALLRARNEIVFEGLKSVRESAKDFLR